jgi:hypothetical protein
MSSYFTISDLKNGKQSWLYRMTVNNQSSLLRIREVLVEMKDRRITEGRGICGNLDAQSKFDYSWLALLDEIALHWPHHSKDPAYPIPGGREVYRLHQQCGTLWAGVQLAMRKDLIDFVVREIDMAILKYSNAQ